MSTTSTLSTSFTGVSSYASDLQSVIDRAVQIASMPLEQLQSVASDFSNQETELQTMDGQFSAIQTALDGLNTAATGSMKASVSDSSVVSATADGTALAGTYGIEVLGLGAYSSAYSNAGTTVTDPSAQNISSSSNFTLTVDGTQYTIQPSAQTLSSLASAINSAGAPVQATIVNIGSSSAPDYRLTLQGTKLASNKFQLNDGSQDLLTSLADGSPASYKVNGMPSVIQSDSRAVTLAPGLTVNLLQQSAAGVPDEITVSNDTSGIESAINSFVTAYNAAATEIGKQYGQNAGALQGQSIVSGLSSSLRSLLSYAGTGTIQSLTDLGITVDKTGQMSFDSSTFESAIAANPQAVSDFLGSTGGSGFLKAAGDTLTGIEDPDSGILKMQISSVQDSITQENTLISNKQDQINQLEESLQQQMASADSLIASLESQKTYMTDLFDAMKINSQNQQ
jgi:flagellar hook-associated protein 2